MLLGWAQRRSGEELPGAIVVEPILAGLETADHGMTRRMKVFGGVPVRRRVAAADVPALGAAAQMYPPRPVPQAFLATGSTWRRIRVDVIFIHVSGSDRKSLNAWVHSFRRKPGMHQSMHSGSMARAASAPPMSAVSHPN